MKRVPTEIAKMKGRPSRKLPKNEPKPRVDAPRMPHGLSEPAKREWKRITGECVRLKIITTLDATMLVRYIHEWDFCRELDAQTHKHGFSFIDEKGNPKRAPWDVALVQHATTLRGILNDLGFTPTARAKVSVVQDEEVKAAELLAFDGGKK